MFWIVTNGKYQIVSEHALDNSQDTLLTHGKNCIIGKHCCRRCHDERIIQSSFPRLEVLCPDGKVIVYQPL
jgi:hypothetical protein